MPRKDWYYLPLPIELASVLDEIVEKEAKKFGIIDKPQLVRGLLGDFIERYNTYKDFQKARREIREIKKGERFTPIPFSA